MVVGFRCGFKLVIERKLGVFLNNDRLILICNRFLLVFWFRFIFVFVWFLIFWVLISIGFYSYFFYKFFYI